MKRILAALPVLLLGACATGGSLPPPGAGGTGMAGLERITGLNAAGLVRMLGTPSADVQEGRGRKLQFANRICVLDTYLYPRARGGEQVVTYADARTRDGRPVDKPSCLGALLR